MKRFLIVAALLLFPIGTQAAIISFDPPTGAFNRGDEFAISVRIDIGADCINAIETAIDITGSQARLVDFSTGDSILSLWIERPSTQDMERINTEGRIYFAGGIPGGFCGKIPGDPGPSNLLATLYFRIPSFSVNGAAGEEGLKLAFDPASTTALRNDGRGTAEELILKGAEFSFAPATGLPDTQWQERLKADTIQPEPFTVAVQRDPAMFDGRYYVEFKADDKQTGIDHYEIIELRPGETAGQERPLTIFERLFGRPSATPDWRIAAIPYVLEDQELMSVIKVKALDKAGNERLVEYIPPEPMQRQARSGVSAWIVLILTLIIAAVSSVWAAVRIKKKKFRSAPVETIDRSRADQGGPHENT